jgi:hypothetical protein
MEIIALYHYMVPCVNAKTLSNFTYSPPPPPPPIYKGLCTEQYGTIKKSTAIWKLHKIGLRYIKCPYASWCAIQLVVFTYYKNLPPCPFWTEFKINNCIAKKWHYILYLMQRNLPN